LPGKLQEASTIDSRMRKVRLVFMGESLIVSLTDRSL
jgi:hypothetical protein